MEYPTTVSPVVLTSQEISYTFVFPLAKDCTVCPADETMREFLLHELTLTPPCREMEEDYNRRLKQVLTPVVAEPTYATLVLPSFWCIIVHRELKGTCTATISYVTDTGTDKKDSPVSIDRLKEKAIHCSSSRIPFSRCSKSFGDLFTEGV